MNDLTPKQLSDLQGRLISQIDWDRINGLFDFTEIPAVKLQTVQVELLNQIIGN